MTKIGLCMVHKLQNHLQLKNAASSLTKIGQSIVHKLFKIEFIACFQKKFKFPFTAIKKFLSEGYL
jgi:hypothetical protein